MNISCDNASVCKTKPLNFGDDAVNEERARARGWHIWSGHTHGGEYVTVRLCGSCVGAHRRALPRAPGPAAGDQPTLDI